MKLSYRVGALALLSFLGISFATLAWTEEDERWEHEDQSALERSASLPLAANKRYISECAACHFAYPPSLLPKRSWQKIMATLDDHFGEDAELDSATAKKIGDYLQESAADVHPTRFSRSLLRSIDNHTTPLRISRTRFFLHVHHEIPSKMVKGNPKVRSFSNCASCHTGAERGHFDEDSVRIPGNRRWDD